MGHYRHNDYFLTNICLFSRVQAYQDDVPPASFRRAPRARDGDAFANRRIGRKRRSVPARKLAGEPQDHCQRDVRVGLSHVRALGAAAGDDLQRRLSLDPRRQASACVRLAVSRSVARSAGAIAAAAPGDLERHQRRLFRRGFADQGAAARQSRMGRWALYAELQPDPRRCRADRRRRRAGHRRRNHRPGPHRGGAARQRGAFRAHLRADRRRRPAMRTGRPLPSRQQAVLRNRRPHSGRSSGAAGARHYPSGLSGDRRRAAAAPPRRRRSVLWSRNATCGPTARRSGSASTCR